MNAPPLQDHPDPTAPLQKDQICQQPLRSAEPSGVPPHSEPEAVTPLKRDEDIPILPGSAALPVNETFSGGSSVDLKNNDHIATAYSGDTYLPNSGSSKEGDIMSDEEALRPDLGSEANFKIEDNKFAFSPGQMSKLLNPKSLSAFYALGGIAGLEKGLRTSLQYGLSSDETVLNGYVSFKEAKATLANVNALKKTPVPTSPLPISRAGTAVSLSRKHPDMPFQDRKRVFKDNHLPARKVYNIFQLMWATYQDQVLILLTVAAIISLAIGLYQTFGTVHTPTNPPVEWIEGVAILAAIVIIVVVGSTNDYQKERQFTKLYKKTHDRTVRVIRSGTSQEISIFGILVGDVVHLEQGDVIPADGIFIDGYNVRCDESSVTGESDLMRKQPAYEVFQAIEGHKNLPTMDPFIISGAKVVDGVGTFLVTATGTSSSQGTILMTLQEQRDITPLQSRLNTLAGHIAKFGAAAALLLFIILFIEFLAKLSHSTNTPTQKGQTFVNIIIITLTVVVIAVPEGLPLAVTLALAFATTRMLKGNNLVRRLKACETMGNATDVCTDKTGTLTQNRMTVVAGTLGTSSRFVDKKAYHSIAPGPNHAMTRAEQATPIGGVDGVTTDEFIGYLSDDVKLLFEQSIVINSTAFEGQADGQEGFIGSKTETALLAFSRDYLGTQSVSAARGNAKIVQLFPFDASRKYMATVVKIENGKYRLYVKGAPEVLLRKCTRILRDPTKEVSDTTITADNIQHLDHVITMYASRSLRTIGLLYRDFEQWSEEDTQAIQYSLDNASPEDPLNNLVFLAVFGIRDPLRNGVREAVQACQNAGVFVRMVTGDNVLTAKVIAEECGILSRGGKVMEGSKFRALSKSEMDRIIPQLQVLARSSPTDKRILVRRLKDLGKIVAVTGDGTNDALALKTADVGFSMGISGTEVAKEASDIILMDDNFSSIVKAIMWGRAINDAVKKFLQFQVTISITTVVLTFVSAVASSKEQSVLTPVQLMWVNLIQDTMAALALATDPPTPSILNRRPEHRSSPLITLTMWKMIIGQATYQLAVTLILYFGGESILSYQSPREHAQLPTLVFNTFVWMQIFNQINNRRLDNKFNIFEGIFSNWFFIAISVIMMGCQVMIVFVGGTAFSARRLNRAQWLYSVVLGALSILVGAVIRLIPDEHFEKRYQRLLSGQAPTALDEEQLFPLPIPLEEIREDEA
ncbi:calcium-translocating P-type ATPase [Glonium stellatum]|uniref:Calcium-transporting ATPase n=1 Tax=Glonium stellatum TaxID=574774 RepID=A0A8E2F3U2_9PEZI|nr:calcium-translocating P-type ATPase [Glonium stellatum]